MIINFRAQFLSGSVINNKYVYPTLSWAGHQIHVSLPINKLLDLGVNPKDIPLPHEFILNKSLMIQLYPSFKNGLSSFFTLNWFNYADFLTFKGGFNPINGSLWLTDIAHHHLALSIIFIFAGHMYKTNWKIGHDMQQLLENHKGPFTVALFFSLLRFLTYFKIILLKLAKSF